MASVADLRFDLSGGLKTRKLWDSGSSERKKGPGYLHDGHVLKGDNRELSVIQDGIRGDLHASAKVLAVRHSEEINVEGLHCPVIQGEPDRFLGVLKGVIQGVHRVGQGPAERLGGL